MKTPENNTLAGKFRSESSGSVKYVKGTACAQDPNARAKIKGNIASGRAPVGKAPMI